MATEFFKSRNLTYRFACWYLIILELKRTFGYLPGRANVAADSLPTNVPVGVVTSHPPVIESFSLDQLRVAHCNDGALESGAETNLPALLVSFSQFFLSDERILCRC